MNAMSFINSDLKKQSQALEVTLPRTTNHSSPTNLFQQYIKTWSEWEIEFQSSYFSDKGSNVYKIRKFVSLEYFFC